MGYWGSQTETWPSSLKTALKPSWVVYEDVCLLQLGAVDMESFNMWTIWVENSQSTRDHVLTLQNGQGTTPDDPSHIQRKYVWTNGLMFRIVNRVKLPLPQTKNTQTTWEDVPIGRINRSQLYQGFKPWWIWVSETVLESYWYEHVKWSPGHHFVKRMIWNPRHEWGRQRNSISELFGSGLESWSPRIIEPKGEDLENFRVNQCWFSNVD